MALTSSVDARAGLFGQEANAELLRAGRENGVFGIGILREQARHGAARAQRSVRVGVASSLRRETERQNKDRQHASHPGCFGVEDSIELDHLFSVSVLVASTAASRVRARTRRRQLWFPARPYLLIAQKLHNPIRPSEAPRALVLRRGGRKTAACAIRSGPRRKLRAAFQAAHENLAVTLLVLKPRARRRDETPLPCTLAPAARSAQDGDQVRTAAEVSRHSQRVKRIAIRSVPARARECRRHPGRAQSGRRVPP